jgi:glycosidase
LPWTPDGSSFGFGDDGAWLPQPEGWGTHAVSAQAGDAASFLELYRSALRLRRAHPALGGTNEVNWCEAPGDDLLVFTRDPGFGCVVNFGPAPAPIPLDGRVVLSSDHGTTEGEVPPHGAVWLERA